MVLAALWHNQQKITDWEIHPQLPPSLLLSARDDKTAPAQKSEEIAFALVAALATVSQATILTFALLRSLLP
jgi:predicted alpha/beta hydrolase family esterase